jgi:ribonuclease HI
MELMAAIAALESLKERCDVSIVTDSQYLVNSVEKGWVYGWKSKGWRKTGNKPVLNVDLWERMLKQIGKHKVSFKWIRGHDGHVENERCDALAVAASMERDLPEDTRG